VGAGIIDGDDGSIDAEKRDALITGRYRQRPSGRSIGLSRGCCGELSEKRSRAERRGDCRRVVPRCFSLGLSVDARWINCALVDVLVP